MAISILLVSFPPHPGVPLISYLGTINLATSILEVQLPKVVESFQCWVCKPLIIFPVFSKVH